MDNGQKRWRIDPPDFSKPPTLVDAVRIGNPSTSWLNDGRLYIRAFGTVTFSPMAKGMISAEIK